MKDASYLDNSSRRRPPSAAGTPDVRRRRWQTAAALLFWLLLLGGYQWYARQNQLTTSEALGAIMRFLATSAWGPLLYIIVYTLRPLLLLPASLLTISGGLLFGPALGVLVVVVGSNLSASVAYLVGRFFGQSVLPVSGTSDGPLAGLVQRYAERMRRSGFTTILTMRVLFLPYDLVNYLAGLLQIRYGPFLLATALGSLPATVALVLAGASGYHQGELSGGLSAVDPRALAASALIFVGSLVIARLVRRHEQRGGR